MKLFPISPSQLLLSPTHLRGEQGTHLLFELSKRLPNPIAAEDQGLAVGKAPHGLLQALPHGLVKKRSVCGSLDVAVGHLGGQREQPRMQGTGKEKKRLFNITCQCSFPHLEETLGIPDAHSCTSGNHRQLPQWVKIGRTSKRAWKAYAVAWDTWTASVPLGHSQVCLYQWAKQAEPPSLHGKPGGEGSCTSPAELAQPGPTINHLY